MKGASKDSISALPSFKYRKLTSSVKKSSDKVGLNGNLGEETDSDSDDSGGNRIGIFWEGTEKERKVTGKDNVGFCTFFFLSA